MSNLDEAEDVVQDVFVKILSRNKLNEIKNPEAYLRIAVRNASIRSLEKKKKSLPIDEQLPDPSLSLSEETKKTEAKEIALLKQIEKLPEGCRKVFLLCGLDGLKYQEAADKLNLSVNTVKSQMQKAYKMLRESLGGFIMLLFAKKS